MMSTSLELLHAARWSTERGTCPRSPRHKGVMNRERALSADALRALRTCKCSTMHHSLVQSCDYRSPRRPLETKSFWPCFVRYHIWPQPEAPRTTCSSELPAATYPHSLPRRMARDGVRGRSTDWWLVSDREPLADIETHICDASYLYILACERTDHDTTAPYTESCHLVLASERSCSTHLAWWSA